MACSCSVIGGDRTEHHSMLELVAHEVVVLYRHRLRETMHVSQIEHAVELFHSLVDLP